VVNRVLLLSLALGAVGCASRAALPRAEVDDAPAPVAAANVEVEQLAGERAEPAAPKLIVHEWGTFTARLDDHGNLRTWTPHDRVEPLPKFVFESWTTPAKQQAKGTVRMETPVLYFYADEPTRASAIVEFPGGFLTEWYPFASHEDTVELARLTWPSFEIRPGLDPEYPVDGDSHYYAARNTDATPLFVTLEDDEVQREKMLFYRGVGSFALPLQGRTTKAGIELIATTKLDGVIVFGRHGDKLGFEVIDSLVGSREVQRPAHDDELEDLTAEVARILVAQGLYEREAAAMIETWQELWFEDGLRVLYVVPRRITDELLPLTLEPTPDELVRTLVGRLDFPK
jgi:hypothetical protein